jgi:4'-phosphopantetheinyl transferase
MSAASPKNVSPMTQTALSARAVHVRYMFTDQIPVVGALRRYYPLLCHEERDRYRRFAFDEDRHTFLLAHGLLRTSLSRYAAAPPERWRFSSPSLGRPEIAEPPSIPRLRFNLSHTKGLVACALTKERDIGVDVEYVRAAPLTERVAGRHFARVEIEALGRLAGHARTAAFFDYWTLKESYVKARGEGLDLQLDGFSFRLPPDAPPQVSFSEMLQDDPAAWQFALHLPGPGHRLAVAVRRESGTDLDLELTDVTALEESESERLQAATAARGGTGW